MFLHGPYRLRSLYVQVCMSIWFGKFLKILEKIIECAIQVAGFYDSAIVIC